MVIMSPYPIFSGTQYVNSTPSSSGTQYVNGHNVPPIPSSNGTQYMNGHIATLPRLLAVHSM